jgi:hypothetical protein
MGHGNCWYAKFADATQYNLLRQFDLKQKIVKNEEIEDLLNSVNKLNN